MMDTPTRVLYHGSKTEFHGTGTMIEKDDPMWGTVIETDNGGMLWFVREGSYTVLEEES